MGKIKIEKDDRKKIKNRYKEIRRRLMLNSAYISICDTEDLVNRVDYNHSIRTIAD